MNRYQRHLPHWDAIGQPQFVTFRLHGSLPAGRVFPSARITNGQAFVAMDRLLDHARSGPFWLKDPKIAAMVVGSLRDGEQNFHRYTLHAFVVMANHVHLLVTPRVIARQWLGPLKGFTAHEGIRILGLQATPFWQAESFDHLVRSEQEFVRIHRYIEQNPVKAGVVTTPEEFLWSSAAPGGSPAAARKG
jgi:putative transposase